MPGLHRVREDFHIASEAGSRSAFFGGMLGHSMNGLAALLELHSGIDVFGELVSDHVRLLCLNKIERA